MKNILSDLKENILDIEDKPINYLFSEQDPKTKDKLYAFFFYASFHPNFEEAVDSLINFYFSIMKEDNLEIFFCSCDEDKMSYQESNDIIKSKLLPKESCNSDLNSKTFFISFRNGNGKDSLIRKFKIDTVPRLVIINSQALIISELNNSEIINLTEDIFNIWIKKNKASLLSGIKVRFNIGDKVTLTLHQHGLIFTDYTLKKSEYRTGTWHCDECGKSYGREVKNLYCGLCSYDLCMECYDKLC